MGRVANTTKPDDPPSPTDESSTHIYSVPDGHLIGFAPKNIRFFTSLHDSTTLLGWKELEDWSKTQDTMQLFSWKLGQSKAQRYNLPPNSQSQVRDFWLLPDRETLVVHYLRSVSNVGVSELQFWDLNTKKRRFHVKEGYNYVDEVLSASNGLCAWINIETDRIELWNYKTGRRQNTFPAFGTKALSPDGRLLTVEVRGSRVINLWDTKTTKLIRSFKSHQSDIHALNFSPDGRTLASGDDGTIKLWRIK